VRWDLRYALSYRDLEEMMRQRGLRVDHTTISRWVQREAPELKKRCRPHLKACNDSWRVDETSITIRKSWMDLSRVVDSQGNTLAFLVSPTRDAKAAKSFFVKALHSTAGSVPGARPIQEQVAQPMVPAEPTPTTSALGVINVEKNAATPSAIAELKANGVLLEAVKLKPGQLLEEPDRARSINDRV